MLLRLGADSDVRGAPGKGSSGAPDLPVGSGYAAAWTWRAATAARDQMVAPCVAAISGQSSGTGRRRRRSRARARRTPSPRGESGRYRGRTSTNEMGAVGLGWANSSAFAPSSTTASAGNGKWSSPRSMSSRRAESHESSAIELSTERVTSRRSPSVLGSRLATAQTYARLPNRSMVTRC
jgi:hypothetical protein